MSLADDLLKLEAMKNAGSLTDSEFEDAKRVLLRDADAPAGAQLRDAVEPNAWPVPSARTDRAAADAATLGVAVNRYVDLKTREYNNGKIVALIGGLVFVLIAIAICAGFSGGSDGDPSIPTGTCTWTDPNNVIC